MRKYRKIDGHTESEWNELHKIGQLAFTWEQACKAEWKKERREDKHKLTIAKKAARQTIADYAKLEMDIAKLKMEIEYLRDRASRFDLHLLSDLKKSGQLELDVDKI